VVIGNGTEGEPASPKDKVLMARSPHLVLDGAVCAEALPELITLDDWGFPIIARQVPGDLEDQAAETVRLCPRLALRLER
jgi:ferredoxin